VLTSVTLENGWLIAAYAAAGAALLGLAWLLYHEGSHPWQFRAG
jgi:hypothetical protein